LKGWEEVTGDEAMKKEIWIWDCLEHETTWIRATDLEDATNIIMDALEKPTPYPKDWPPQFALGEEVELDRGKRGRILSFLGGWNDELEDMEVYEVEVVEEDP